MYYDLLLTWLLLAAVNREKKVSRPIRDKGKLLSALSRILSKVVFSL